MANSTTNIDTISQSQSAKEVTANAFFDAASPATLFGRRASTCGGLTWGYYGGTFTKADGTRLEVSNSTLTLTASATNYVTVLRSTGVVYCATTTTAWDDTHNYLRLYSVVAGASSVTSYTDCRELGKLTGYRRPSAPVTKTGNFTQAVTDDFIICNGTASITATLLDPAAYTGRSVKIKTVAAYTVVSASSNVVPLAGGSAGTSILAATAGKWAELVSDGTNWVIMAGA
jgi:hypothetical protein